MSMILKCSPLHFYSRKDEDALFEWIDKIKCIKKVQGIGRELHLTIQDEHISDEDLVDLMGLFSRYKFDQKQLTIFKTETNKHWFD